MVALEIDLAFVNLVRVDEHNVIDRHICYLSRSTYLPGIWQDEAWFDIIVQYIQQVVDGAVNGIILTWFNLDRQYACVLVVINQKINLTFLFVVIIEEIVPVCL